MTSEGTGTAIVGFIKALCNASRGLSLLSTFLAKTAFFQRSAYFNALQNARCPSCFAVGIFFSVQYSPFVSAS